MAQSVSLQEQIIRLATALDLRVAIAESLTGGLLAATLIDVPGASRVVSGAVVAYDTALKHTLLNVDRDLLSREGPVHSEVAQQMAYGVRGVCAVPRDSSELQPAEIGVSTTGVAGPDPDPQTGQAPGTVWIGVSIAEQNVATKVMLTGGRDEIRRAAVHEALKLIFANLSQVGSSSANLRE